MSETREQRVDAVIAAFLDDVAAGRAPDRTALLAEYADLADDLRSFLADHDRMRRAAKAEALPTPGPAGSATVGVVEGGDAPEVPRAFGDYELLEEVARGGMGVVWKARQVSLNRVVALKMILAGQFASQADVERFRREAEAVAQLDHPNIVPVYEVGQHQGHHFFSMKLIEGGSLAAVVSGQWSVASEEERRQRIEILTAVARAVHFAHQRGILHRDLKPANILLGSSIVDRRLSIKHNAEGGPSSQSSIVNHQSSIPYVTDFGLARRVEGDSDATRSGAIVGTPSYMAPEQARASKTLTTAVDVYSLGAILYEMLTGRPPFQGESPLDTLLQVIEKDLAPPSAVRPGLDRDLETICLKCLEREPSRRYDSAAALADDLERWLRGEPILARRTGTWERAIKWAKRRPAIAALAASLAIVTLLGVAGIAWKWQQAEASDASARKGWDEERKARHRAETAEENERNERIAREKAAESEAVAHDHTLKAKNLAEEALKRADGLRLSAEAAAARTRDPALSLLLGLEGVKRVPNTITWNVLYDAAADCREIRTVTELRTGMRFVRYAPDGKHVLVVGTPPGEFGRRVNERNSAGAVWLDVETGQQKAAWRGYGLPPAAFDLSADGRLAAVAGTGNGNVLYEDEERRESKVFTDRVTYLFDPATGKDVLHLNRHKDHVVSARFSPDGTKVVTASWDETARLWDARTGKLLHVLAGHQCSLLDALFSPDGKRVLTVTSGRNYGGHGRILSLEEEKEPQKAPKDRDAGIDARPGFFGQREWMEYSSDSRCESPVARLFDAETGKVTALCHRTLPNPIAITGKAPILIRGLWLLGESLPNVLRGHSGHPRGAAFSPDGSLVAIAFGEGFVCVWDAAKGGKEKFVLKAVISEMTAVAFSPDGQVLVTGEGDGTVRLWDPLTGKELRQRWGHEKAIRSIQFSRDGARFLTASDDRTARVWERTSTAGGTVLLGHKERVISADFSPDGRRVVTTDGHAVHFWHLDPAGSLATVLQGHGKSLVALEFTPDGKHLLTAGPDETPRLWDATTGREVLVVGKDKHLGTVHAAHLSADGRYIVTGSENTEVRDADGVVNASAVHLWDAKTGRDVLALKDHEQGALHAALSPDGATLLTVTDGWVRTKRIGDVASSLSMGDNLGAGTLRLWDAKTGKLRAAVEGKVFEEFPPRFSPDGKLVLAVLETGGGFSLIDAATGKVRRTVRVERLEQYGKKPFAIFSPDGKQLAVSTGENGVRLWDVERGHLLASFQGFDHLECHPIFSADGKRLAVLSAQSAHVFDVQTRRELVALRGHGEWLRTAVFRPDGNALLTGCEDRTAALWDIATGKMLALYRGHAGPVERVAFSPDGKLVATSTSDGSARVWPANLLPVLVARAPRTFTEAERERYELPDPDAKPETKPRERILTIVPEPGEKVEPLTPREDRFDADRLARAALKLDELEAKIKDARGDPEPIRRELLSMERDLAGSTPALKAASLLPRLPSPLDSLDATKIPAADRPANAPKELVAVLGERRLRHPGGIDGLLVSRDGKLVVTASGYNQKVLLWDAATLTERGSLTGRLIGLSKSGELMTHTHTRLTYWDLGQSPPKQVRTVVIPETWDGVFSVDGKWAVIRSRAGNINLWELGGDRPVLRGKLDARAVYVNDLVFSPDGKWLAYPMRQSELLLWRTDAPADPPLSLKIPEKHPIRPTFSPDGATLAAGTAWKTVRLWDLTGAAPREKPSFATTGKNEKELAARLHFAADGKTLVLSTDEGDLELWDIAAEKPRLLTRGDGSGSTLSALALSPDGRLLFGGQHAALRAWEWDGKELKDRAPPRGHLTSPGTLDFSPDGRWLLSAGNDRQSILWDLSGPEPKEAHRIPRSGWQSSFTPDGKGLVTSGRATTFWELTADGPRRKGDLPGHRYAASALTFTPDGRRLVTSGSEPPLCLWDLSGPEPRRLAETAGDKNEQGPGHLSLSPDGRFLAGGYYMGTRQHLSLWKVEEKSLREIRLPNIEAMNVAFAPDGRSLAYSKQGGFVHLLDLSSPVPVERAALLVADPDAYHGGTPRFVFGRDGRRLWAYSGDLMTAWDVTDGKQLGTWKFPETTYVFAVSPDGRHVAVGNNGGTISILRLEPPPAWGR